MSAGSQHDIQDILGRARVRIGQAAQLLQQQCETPIVSAEQCLFAADMLWRELVRRHEEEPELWRTAQVDGLRTERVLDRLNDIVYELLCALTMTPPRLLLPGSDIQSSPPPR